jgi:hypothetical protein
MTWLYFVFAQSVFVFVGQTLTMGLCAPRTFLHGGGAGSAASLIDPQHPIFTVPRCLPPAAFRGESYTEVGRYKFNPAEKE